MTNVNYSRVSAAGPGSLSLTGWEVSTQFSDWR